MSEIHDGSGDSEIMDATFVEDKALVINVQGERFSSEPLEERPNAEVIGRWCNAVRAFARQLEEERAAKRSRGPLEAPGQPSPGPEKEDPDQWIRIQHNVAWSRLKSAEEELEEAEKVYKKWDKLYQALGLTDEEEKEDADD